MRGRGINLSFSINASQKGRIIPPAPPVPKKKSALRRHDMGSEFDVYRRLIARWDVWSKQDTTPGKNGKFGYTTKKYPLTRKIVEDSLLGNKTTIGVYTVKPVDDTVVNSTVDMDNHDGKSDIINDVKIGFAALKGAGMFPYIESSAGALKNGAHVGVICKPTAAALVKRDVEAAFKTAGLKHEVNPKQERVEEGGYGNLVKLPWQYNNRTKARSQIINPETLEPFTRDEGIKYMLALPDTVFPEIKGIENPVHILKDAPAQSSEAVKSDIIPDVSFDNTFNLDNIKPCIKACYEGKWVLHGNGDEGHNFRIAIAGNLLYNGASDEQVHEYLKIQADYSQKATNDQLKSIREYLAKNKKPSGCKNLMAKCSALLNGMCATCSKKPKEKIGEEQVIKTCGNCKYKPVRDVGNCRHPYYKAEAVKPHYTEDINLACEKWVVKPVTKFKTKPDEVNIIDVAEQVLEKIPVFSLVDNPDEMYYYDSGVFKKGAQVKIRAVSQEILGYETSKYNINEIIFYIQNKTFVERTELNKEKYIINLKNGLYNVNTKTFEPHTSTVLSTCQIPTEYNPQATCPNISKFLCEILRPRDIATILQEIGYALIPDYTIQKIFLWDGDGLNGKGTLGRVIIALIGVANKSSVAMQTLNTDKFGAIDLYGKLINMEMDLPATTIIDDNIIKKLSGGDGVRVQDKFGKPFDLYNYARLFFGCNRVPQHPEKSDAWNRRMLQTSFPCRFEKTENKNLDAELQTPEELSGLLNLCLEALHWLLEDKTFFDNRSLDEVGEEYLIKSNSVMAFMKEFTTPTDDYVISNSLYEAYLRWGKINGLKKVEAKNIFGKLLRRGGYEQDKPYINGKQEHAYYGFVLNLDKIQEMETATRLEPKHDAYTHWYQKQDIENQLNENQDAKTQKDNLSRVSRVMPQIIIREIITLCKKDKKIDNSSIYNKIQETYLGSNPANSTYEKDLHTKQEQGNKQGLSRDKKTLDEWGEPTKPPSQEPSGLRREITQKERMTAPTEQSRPNNSVRDKIERGGKEYQKSKGTSINSSNIVEFVGWFYDQFKDTDPAEIELLARQIFGVTPVSVIPVIAPKPIPKPAVIVPNACVVCNQSLDGKPSEFLGVGRGYVHLTCKHEIITVNSLRNVESTDPITHKRMLMKKGGCYDLPAIEAMDNIRRGLVERVIA